MARFSMKKWAVIVAVLLTVFVLAGIAAYSCFGSSDAYMCAAQHLCSGGLCDSAAQCRLKGGSIFGGKAGFNIAVGDEQYTVLLERVNGQWTVTYCDKAVVYM